MNNRRAPLQMTAPVDSVPNIPFRTFLLRAHLLRILWAPMMSVMLFAIVLPINREPYPVLYDTLMSLIFLGEIVFSAIMIIAVSKALKYRS